MPFHLFNFASFDNCGGIPRAPVTISFPRTTGTLPHCRAVPEEGTGSCSLRSACYQHAKAQLRAHFLMIWDARPFQDREANLVSNGVSIWRRLTTKWYTLIQYLSTWGRSMSGGLFLQMGQRHMPTHPLKAWSLDEWVMPTASTGVSTSFGADYCWWLRAR